MPHNQPTSHGGFFMLGNIWRQVKDSYTIWIYLILCSAPNYLRCIKNQKEFVANDHEQHLQTQV